MSTVDFLFFSQNVDSKKVDLSGVNLSGIFVSIKLPRVKKKFRSKQNIAQEPFLLFPLSNILLVIREPFSK